MWQIHNKRAMDACLAVEREIDKVLSKFEEVGSQSGVNLEELLSQIQGIKKELEEGNP